MKFGINPAYSRCSEVNETSEAQQDIRLACGHSLDRDLNAAINIRNKVYGIVAGRGYSRAA